MFEERFVFYKLSRSIDSCSLSFCDRNCIGFSRKKAGAKLTFDSCCTIERNCVSLLLLFFRLQLHSLCSRLRADCWRRVYLPFRRNSLCKRLYSRRRAARGDAADYAEILLGVQNLRRAATRMPRDNAALYLRLAGHMCR